MNKKPALSWEDLDALITETLESGKHPETREASVSDVVDNNGEARGIVQNVSYTESVLERLRNANAEILASLESQPGDFSDYEDLSLYWAGYAPPIFPFELPTYES